MFKDYGHPHINKIMESFVPVKHRTWFPFALPTEKWWDKATDKQKEDFWTKIRAWCNEDFFFFANYIMRNAGDQPLQIGLHDEMCHILQYGDSDIGMLVPRGHLKSTLCSGAYPIWCLAKDPNLVIMICSSVSDLAQSLMSYISNQIASNEHLKQVFPELLPAYHELGATRLKLWNKQAITVKRDQFRKEPSILTMGLDNQPKTGFHCSMMIYDDIVTYENSDTPDKIKRTKMAYDFSLNLPNPGARILYVGTRYDHSDIYGELIRNGEVGFYVRPVVEEGKYIWTWDENIKRVEKMRKVLSPHVFASQYMNNPIPEGEAEFEEKWIQRWNYDLLRVWMKKPDLTDDEVFWEWVKTLDVHLGCDPNRSDKKRSDFGVIMAAGVDTKGHVYCLYMKRKRMNTEELVNSYIEAFDMWNPKTAKVEVIGGDIHVFNNIKQRMREQKKAYTRVSEYEISHKMSGDDRIRNLQYPMSQGLIWFGPKQEWDSVIHDELLRFPYGDHDDGITTLAYMWSQQMKPKKEKAQKPNRGAWQTRQGGQYRERHWLLA